MERKEKILSLKEQLKALKYDERTLSIKMNTNRKNQQVIKREVWQLNNDVRIGDDILFKEAGERKETRALLIGLDVDRTNIIFPIVKVYNKHNKPHNRERLISLAEQKSLKKA